MSLSGVLIAQYVGEGGTPNAAPALHRSHPSLPKRIAPPIGRHTIRQAYQHADPSRAGGSQGRCHRGGALRNIVQSRVTTTQRGQAS